MSRPQRENIDRTSPDWVQRFNEQMAKALDAPVPFVTATDISALTSSFNPKLYKDCLAIVGNQIYMSDGTNWNFMREQLGFVADLDPATATLSDWVTAYNNLLADMQAKGWML